MESVGHFGLPPPGVRSYRGWAGPTRWLAAYASSTPSLSPVFSRLSFQKSNAQPFFASLSSPPRLLSLSLSPSSSQSHPHSQNPTPSRFPDPYAMAARRSRLAAPTSSSGKPPTPPPPRALTRTPKTLTKSAHSLSIQPRPLRCSTSSSRRRPAATSATSRVRGAHSLTHSPPASAILGIWVALIFGIAFECAQGWCGRWIRSGAASRRWWRRRGRTAASGRCSSPRATSSWRCAATSSKGCAWM